MLFIWGGEVLEVSDEGEEVGVGAVVAEGEGHRLEGYAGGEPGLEEEEAED